MPPAANDSPPFPPLTWETYWWEGADILPTWAGFAVRHDAYGPRRGPIESLGRVCVRVSPLGGLTDGQRPVVPEQVAAYRFLKENEARVSAAVWDAITAAYPERRRQAIECTVSPKHVRELEKALPADLTPARLRDVVSLQTINVLAVERDSIAYVGFILECAWEEEHGLGVLTHLDRIATVGDADDADTEWVAHRDGGRAIVASPS